MDSDQVVHKEFIVDDDACASAKVRHDIRSSLAITRGFSQALESSFEELCQTVEQALSACDPRIDGETVAGIASLEADCSFCLSRIKRSLEQLSVRVEASAPAVITDEQSGRISS